MSQLDDLTAAVADGAQAESDLTASVQALTAEVAAVSPGSAPDLSGALAGVASNSAASRASKGAVDQAVADLKAKFPA